MKTCSKCNLPKDEKQFSFSNKAKQTLHSYCKSCAKKIDRTCYLRNKEQINKRSQLAAKQRRIRNQEYIWKYLLNHPCVSCGEADVLVLEFNHIDPSKKKSNVSKLVHKGTTIENIDNEIAKCEVLCANCHRRYTAIQRNSFLINKIKSLK